MSRASILSRFSLTAGAVLALTGCLDHPIKKVAYDKTSEAQKNVAIAINKDVDILFVIDNSGSMAEEQALLSKNFASFINVLEAEDVNANYRIGITTTDSGNPRCPKATYNPEGGKLVLSSCVDRVGQGEFSFNMNDFAYACTDYCDLTDAQLAIKPTATQFSNGDTAPRKWIERIEGQTNLPDDVTTVQAFQCFGPQGVAGCGFESHLESMYLALAQASSKDSTTNYGFLRDQAILSVVIISDETDCSYTGLGAEIFTTNKVFWNDPSDPAPTSALCWRAGVKCDGSSPTWDRCYASNHGLDGAADVADTAAVLQPLSKYTNFVQGLEDQKRMFDVSQEVLVAAIAGVPVGYDKNTADIIYEDTDDVDFQTDFGIGPGCVLAGMNGDPDSRAVPPVREREFAEAFQVGDERNLFSICQNDYSAALEAIAAKIRDQIKPACMPSCIKDVDPTTEIVDESCTLIEENTATMMQSPIPKCEKNGANFVPPAGSTVCYIALVDQAGLTATPDDDMSQQCIDEGWNLEFKLFRSGPAPAGSTVTAVCELSALKSVDCPNL